MRKTERFCDEDFQIPPKLAITNRRLLILGCSRTKAGDRIVNLSARARYDGPLWQTLRATDPYGAKAHVALLSAKYGFRRAHHRLPDYDELLTPSIAAKIIANGIHAPWPVPRLDERCPTPFEMLAINVRDYTARGRYTDKPFTDVALCGGALYLRVMRAFVDQFKEAELIARDARLIEINDLIGLMRRDLANWLNNTASPTARRGRQPKAKGARR